MKPAFWVWLLMLIWAFLGWFREYNLAQPYLHWRYGAHLLVFIILVIVVWHDFGSPLSALIQ